MTDPLSFMRRAMELAEQGRGRCSPNPFVGAVIVREGRIIGEGNTQPYGFEHAEVMAIANSIESCAGAEMFVTLEPCSHYGKTPPCAKAIIEAGISKVSIGIMDPNPLVNGKGIAMLRSAGIEVRTGLLASEIAGQLEYYLTPYRFNRPFIILKTAVTSDGRIAPADRSHMQITGSAAVIKVHELRSEVDAILTGIGTVMADNPQLNVRFAPACKQPLRIVLDSRLALPADCHIALSAHTQPVLVFTDKSMLESPQAEALKSLGIEICGINSSEGKVHLAEVMSVLHDRRVQSLLVEAGTDVNTSFLQAGLVDKLYMFIAPMRLGESALPWNSIAIDNIQEVFSLEEVSIIPCGEDLLLTAYIGSNSLK